MERVKRYIMDRRDIGFLKQILESYEELAIFSVLDSKAGLIEMIYPVHSGTHIESLVEDMVRQGISFQEADDV
jgi:hypothetical protein